MEAMKAVDIAAVEAVMAGEVVARGEASSMSNIANFVDVSDVEAVPMDVSNLEMPPSKASDDMDVVAVEAVVGYTFQDKELLGAALTHESFRGRRPNGDETSYERLEFLGDRVINLGVAFHFFLQRPKMNPDRLSPLVSVNVDKEKLARATVAHGLHHFLRHNMHDFHEQINHFTEEITEYAVHSYGLVHAPKFLSDIIESLVGAIFIDSGKDLEQAFRVFLHLTDPLIGLETMEENPKTEFQKIVNAMPDPKPEIEKDPCKSDTFRVIWCGETIGSATYPKSASIARIRAVKVALDTMKARKVMSGGAMVHG